jgi:hypothetical protein
MCQAGNAMKKIKRTTIKIRRRELVILKSGGRSGGGSEEIMQICPVCNSPVSNQLDEHEKPAAKLLAENKD